jgi:hypothetical protein
MVNLLFSNYSLFLRANLGGWICGRSDFLDSVGPRLKDSVGESPTALLPRLGLKPEANSQNHDQQVGGVTIDDRPEFFTSEDLTRFNGFELLAWDFNPRWAMRSSVSTQIEFATHGIINQVPSIAIFCRSRFSLALFSFHKMDFAAIADESL